MRNRSFRLLFLLTGIWLFTGCSTAPHIYTMPPREVENIRADLAAVGVVLLEDLPKTEVLMPAKGSWGGFKRGVAVGATLPVMIGFVSPIPGGTLLGAMVAPFTAAFGGVYGAATAPPVQEVEGAERMLENVSDHLRKMGLRAEFYDEVIRLGNARTGLEFTAFADIAPEAPHRDVSYNLLDLRKVDAILELKTEKAGLRGKNSIDPPTDVFIQIRIRLIRVEENFVLLDETFFCLSDQERTFAEWTEYNGRFLVDEFRSCIPELAEKIIDDFFLVYPIFSH